MKALLAAILLTFVAGSVTMTSAYAFELEERAHNKVVNTSGHWNNIILIMLPTFYSLFLSEINKEIYSMRSKQKKI